MAADTASNFEGGFQGSLTTLSLCHDHWRTTRLLRRVVEARRTHTMFVIIDICPHHIVKLNKNVEHHL